MIASRVTTVLLIFLAMISIAGCINAQASPAITVTSISQSPVMSTGAAGTWDSVDVMNPSVFTYQGELVDYYSGWNGTIWQTGIATSLDGGNTWQKQPNPMLSPGTGGWATTYIAADGSTLLFNGQVLTYYMGQGVAGTSQIGLAIADPAHQLTQTALPAPVVPNGAVTDPDARDAGDPFVMQAGNQLMMYYVGEDENWHTSFMQAVSFDGVHWLKNEKPIMTADPSSPWENAAIGEPCVFQYGGTYFMVYTGSTPQNYRSLLWATSPDGYTWTKQGLLIPQASRPAFASQVMADPSVVATSVPGQFLVFYGGGNIPQGSQNLNGRIGLITIQVTP